MDMKELMLPRRVEFHADVQKIAVKKEQDWAKAEGTGEKLEKL